MSKMGTPHKLLIIDDNTEMLAALGDFFKSKNQYEVSFASDGLEGLKLIESGENVFDLIITDIVMPNISGIGVISILKNKFPDTPVIAITGWGEHPEALAAEAQADYVLEKPFELKKLLNLIERFLN